MRLGGMVFSLLGVFRTHRFIIVLGFSFVKSRGCLGVGWKQQPALSSSLNVRLVVASNSIANRNKVEFLGVKDVALFLGKLDQTLCQIVVKLFLLDGVVARRMLEVVISIFDQETFQLRKK